MDFLKQLSVDRIQNNFGKPKKKTIIVTDPSKITELCFNQPRVSAERMRQSIIFQNSK